MRTILIDWINEVHHQFKLEIDTYHMTVSLIDRYLQKVKSVPKKKLQLVGVTAMFVASKYEELFPPEIHDFVFITDDTYQKYQILEMEKEMVKVLDFQLGKPLPTHFLRRFSKAAKASDVNHVLAKYLIELASVDYSTAHYKPSERLANVIKAVPKMMEKKLKSPWLKYSSSKLQCISTHPKLRGEEIERMLKELPV
uniref:Uncharacterized protein n=1 Tax=Anopheles farauti TaxID=69004 RepID=A0A182QB00_9DIPT